MKADEARLEAEVKALRAQVERYEKPVSDEELRKYFSESEAGPNFYICEVRDVDAIIASRKAAKND